MLKSTCRFFKDKKIVEPVGHVHFVVFETFSSAYYTKLHQKSWRLLLLVNNVQRVKADVNFGSARALFVPCTRVT